GASERGAAQRPRAPGSRSPGGPDRGHPALRGPAPDAADPSPGRRRLEERTADAALERDLAAADRVDRDARAVRRVFDGEAHLEVHRDVAESAPLHAEEAHLVVLLPRHEVRRSDVDVLGLEPDIELRLNRLGLRDLLRL